MKYKIVFESTIEDFELKVNELLEGGWELYGGHQTTSDANDDNGHLSQALTYDESKDRPAGVA